MTWTRRILLVGVLIFILTLTGCYTVVTIPKRTVHRVETDEYILDEEEYEDVIDEVEDEATDEAHHYYHYDYGDPWTFTILYRQSKYEWFIRNGS